MFGQNWKRAIQNVVQINRGAYTLLHLSIFPENEIHYKAVEKCDMRRESYFQGLRSCPFSLYVFIYLLLT